MHGQLDVTTPDHVDEIKVVTQNKRPLSTVNNILPEADDSTGSCATISKGDPDLQLYVGATGDDKNQQDKFWEIEQGNDYQTVNVLGRLKEKLVFWKDTLKALTTILECVREGYKLPLLLLPPPFAAKNKKKNLP